MNDLDNDIDCGQDCPKICHGKTLFEDHVSVVFLIPAMNKKIVLCDTKAPVRMQHNYLVQSADFTR